MEFHGIAFPDEWQNPRFVETVSGAFTIQIDYEPGNRAKFTEEDRLKLVQLTKAVLQELTGERVESYHKPETAIASKS